jgi:hypothetical protein
MFQGGSFISFTARLRFKKTIIIRESVMILHEAMDQKNTGKEFPAEMPTLMPLDGFEAVSGTDEYPLPFFIFGDDDEMDGEDIEDDGDFDDAEEDFGDEDDDDFEDDDFDDDDEDEDDFEDEEDDYDYEEDADYDDFDE